MKFQVAIIGSPGSGKTVLTAVLSRYLSGHSDRIYMNPREAYEYIGENSKESISTMSYISRTLEFLHNGKWAGRTEGANRCELGFELHIDGNAYEMKLLDSAGEDLQRIFQTYDRTKLSPFQQRLFEYVTSSSAVAIIVNLNDFTDAESLTKRNENEAVITEVVTNLVQARECHYILVCFTAYDKYHAHIKEKYSGNFIQYLKDELPMFYRSCEVASKTVVRDYTEYGYGQKEIRLKCIAVAPVIAQRPAPGINPDRIGMPPTGFDIRNKRHSQGIPQIADWLHECEQSERAWSDVEERIGGHKGWGEILSYRITPIILGAACGLLIWLLLGDLMGHSVSTLILSSLFIGTPIGAGIGFLIGDKLKVLITGKDGLIYKKDRSNENTENEEQEEPVTSRPKYTGGTSTAPPRPSGTGGTGATSGSETLD